MAKEKKATREEIRQAIAARKEARKAEKAAEFSKMREVAKSPEKFAAVVDKLVALTARQSDSMEAFQHNLGLVRAGKNASASEKVRVARAFSKKFEKHAAENPEVIADALREAYKGLDEEAAALELAAEALGVDLHSTPAEAAFADEGKLELEHGEEKGEEIAEEKDETPSFEEAEEKPEEEKEASGSDQFTTDRNKEGQPKSPAKAEIPQSKGEAFKASNKKGGEQQKPTTQEYTISEHSEGAEKFVKEIPQSQGVSEAPSQDKSKSGSKVPAGKQVASGSL